MQDHTGAAPWMSYAMPLVIIAVVMALRWRRMARARPLRVEWLWVLPLVYAAVVGFVFFEMPPSAGGWLWSSLALVAGAVAGWYRGRMMRINVDPETYKLSQQASPAALVLLVGLILVRGVAKQELAGAGPGMAGHGAMLVTEAGMMFALGLIAAMRVEMAIRARRLLAEARSF